MKKILFPFCVALSINSFAQQDSILPKQSSAITFSGYAEVYNTYDFNKPLDNNRPTFIYSHNRHNEFNLNLGYLKAAYSIENVRANLAIATGTYMNANYVAETSTLKNIQEANVGIKISKTKNLWVDAGIFSSHLGFESAVSKDCWNLTRSIVAENSPYFETGAKLTYSSKDNKWILSGLLLNGWQRIQRVNGNSLVSFGSQVQYKPTSTTTINYSTFIGTDKPDNERLWRYYHNVYSIFNLSSKFAVTAGFDLGMEQKATKSKKMNYWYAPLLIARFIPAEKWAVAARAEYYSDKNGVIIATGTPHGFQTTGFSANVDYSPINNAIIRLEARTLNSRDDIFLKGTNVSGNNTFITISIAISF